MTEQDLENHLTKLGYSVERVSDPNGSVYLVIQAYQIRSGSLAGRTCEVALQNFGSIPYTLPPAIHTRPALVPMDMNGSLRTQASAIGSDWQYWSRTRAEAHTPQGIVAHIATIFSEV